MPRPVFLQSNDRLAGGVRLVALMRSLRTTEQRHGFSAFTPYGVPVSRQVAERIAARAVAVRGLANNWELIDQWMLWSYEPEGHGFWERINNSRRTTSEDISRINQTAADILDTEARRPAPAPRPRPSTPPKRVNTSYVPSCCKANIHHGFGNGDPERPRGMPSKADLERQYKGVTGGLGLNELNIAVLRESQVKKLGEDFLESLGWFRMSAPQRELCAHDGVSLFARNLLGTDLRPETQKKKRGA